jgi:hypothetical protein
MIINVRENRQEESRVDNQEWTIKEESRVDNQEWTIKLLWDDCEEYTVIPGDWSNSSGGLEGCVVFNITDDRYSIQNCSETQSFIWEESRVDNQEWTIKEESRVDNQEWTIKEESRVDNQGGIKRGQSLLIPP